ncbi:hypothetical protein PCASD_22623 [Puccinia coronata f. sp. avenae]|uniref:Uncharacterized protein n=1 Tax=Puccinia coronata f. sp. avenae TaxID=200324 RepID=A0A2N5S9F6_9BASI|nr:hypothetical protein PCASD_22623 [Puccinia coronata f. sp. avenae]
MKLIRLRHSTLLHGSAMYWCSRLCMTIDRAASADLRCISLACCYLQQNLLIYPGEIGRLAFDSTFEDTRNAAALAIVTWPLVLPTFFFLAYFNSSGQLKIIVTYHFKPSRCFLNYHAALLLDSPPNFNPPPSSQQACDYEFESAIEIDLLDRMGQDISVSLTRPSTTPGSSNSAYQVESAHKTQLKRQASPSNRYPHSHINPRIFTGVVNPSQSDDYLPNIPDHRSHSKPAPSVPINQAKSSGLAVPQKQSYLSDHNSLTGSSSGETRPVPSKRILVESLDIKLEVKSKDLLPEFDNFVASTIKIKPIHPAQNIR